jgi:hypothetical protein
MMQGNNDIFPSMESVRELHPDRGVPSLYFTFTYVSQQAAVVVFTAHRQKV